MQSIKDKIKNSLEQLKGNDCAHSINRSLNRFVFCSSPENAKELIKQTFILSDDSITDKNFKFIKEYNELIDYLLDNKAKGLTMLGSTGRGKSRILYSVLPVVFNCLQPSRILSPIKAYDLDVKNYKAFVHKSPFVAIDEIGRENIANDFGVKFEIMEYIIDHCEANGKLLFVTSNEKYETLVVRYGQPCVDRLFKITKPITFTGNTLR